MTRGVLEAWRCPKPLKLYPVSPKPVPPLAQRALFTLPKRRRSGRILGHRASFETLRLPTGAITDVFVSKAPQAQPQMPQPVPAAPVPLPPRPFARPEANRVAGEAPPAAAAAAGGGAQGAAAAAGRPPSAASGTAAGGGAGGRGGGGALVTSMSRKRSLGVAAAAAAAAVSGVGAATGAAAAAARPASPAGGGEGALPWGGGSLGNHDALEDGSLTAALVAAGAIKLRP